MKLNQKTYSPEFLGNLIWAAEKFVRDVGEEIYRSDTVLGGKDTHYEFKEGSMRVLYEVHWPKSLGNANLHGRKYVFSVNVAEALVLKIVWGDGYYIEPEDFVQSASCDVEEYVSGPWEQEMVAKLVGYYKHERAEADGQGRLWRHHLPLWDQCIQALRAPLSI